MKHGQVSSTESTGQRAPYLAALEQFLAGVTDLDFAVLVGSRALGTAHADSDWDIALHWCSQPDWLDQLGAQETLRCGIAQTLGVSPDEIDLIDLARASLAMRANVAEDGVVLKGEDGLAWARFLTRTWRELEDFYWERSHAA
jgi:predicted nucleotidyltransferase